MKTTLNKHRWFWAWQDEREEAWLRQMAQSGWHLTSVAPFGFFTFQSGPSEDIIYRLDYHPQVMSQRQANYFEPYTDAGWEHVSEMTGWHYFRKPAATVGFTEIFSDQESRIQNYQRLILFLDIILLPWIIFLPQLPRPEEFHGWYTIPFTLYLLLTVFFLYAIIRLILRIRQMRQY